MAPSIDVVIVAHNRRELTDSCLRHLSAQSAAHSVFIVDNASSDDTCERVRSDWPEVKLESMGSNTGFAIASNRGASAGEAEVVVLLNNDVEVSEDFLERLVAPLQDPAVGSVASLMLQPGGERIDSVGLCADVTLAGFPRLQGLPAARAGEDRPTLAGPAGTAAAYRRSAWRQVGGLDESIFAYMEDLDLALRLRSAGWATAAATDAVGVHLGSATFGHRSAWQRRQGGFARGYLLRRNRLAPRRALRAAAVEAVVVAGDAVISRDLCALRGRVSGWRAGAGRPPLPPPPEEAIDHSIGLRRSLAMRRGVYARDVA